MERYSSQQRIRLRVRRDIGDDARLILGREGVERVGGDRFGDVVREIGGGRVDGMIGHDAASPSRCGYGRRVWRRVRSVSIAVRIRDLTVPSGSPVCVAICCCVRPPK